MFPELDKAYAPQQIEPAWAERWVAERLFEASAADPRPAWSLVIPPPNVTGSLHMGHMLEHTLIDIVVRWQRMQGKNVLWLPGTDHAGIATQMVVERALGERGGGRGDEVRQQMGREAFVTAVWEWKQQSGNRIHEQMVRLGASCDWSRERFTLDEGLSRAVREVFVRLYEEGLIYRGQYLVNWCPRCRTAVSDLEVQHEPATGKLYTVRYRLAGPPADGRNELEVATTRPETILADVAVAVNPGDERYRALIGREVEVPLTGRRVPVIADEIAQPEYGTGAVKITPGHDANDFACGERHHLPRISLFDETARLAGPAAGAYAGLDRFEARKHIVADLDAAGLLAGAADHALALGRCQRCRTVIEPRLSTQWFVKIAPLATAARAVVERGEIRFVPGNNAAIYQEWMANIHDWCISRQLWWGHRIPAWYCDHCESQVVAREAPPACTACGGAMRQDPDVLDTWFSSGLWPFSTLGWPEATADLKAFYPTSLLITGFDILFFWVARMIMLGVHFTGAAPFGEVYIHALVRDADKQKMSKTRGNVIDPLAVTEKYGTDAVRFTLAAMAAPGTDIALAEERMQGYAAFCNKIWNAARFIFLNLNQAGAAAPAAPTTTLRPGDGAAAADRWMFSRLNAVAASLAASLAAYRFDEGAATLYHFFWHEFCDWYLELSKLRLQSGDAAAASAAAANLAAAFEGALRLLHPFTPFITEELWQALYGGNAPLRSIALAPFPVADGAAADPAAEGEVAALQQLVMALRSLRAQWQLAPRTRFRAAIVWRGAVPLDRIAAAAAALAGLERLEETTAIAERKLGYLTMPAFDLQPDLSGLVDIEAERRRLDKERATLAQGVAQLEKQLAGASFRERAPTAVVAEAERLLAERRRQLGEVEASMQALASV